jgi:anti-sigma factor RsiW
MDAPEQSPTSSDDEIIATISDYHDDALDPGRRAEVAAKIADDPTWSTIDAEIRAEKPLLATLSKVTAPPEFAIEVTDTIHRRSAGRFFAKRTLGDRLPVVPLLVVAALLLGAMTTVWCRSPTGSLRAPTGTEVSTPPRGQLAPKP